MRRCTDFYDGYIRFTPTLPPAAHPTTSVLPMCLPLVSSSRVLQAALPAWIPAHWDGGKDMHLSCRNSGAPCQTIAWEHGKTLQFQPEVKKACVPIELNLPKLPAVTLWRPQPTKLWRPQNNATLLQEAWVPPWRGRWLPAYPVIQKTARRKPRYLFHLVLEATHSQFYHSLFIRSESLSPAPLHTQGEKT